MRILIVTSEIGFDGGGMSLSCIRLKDILSKVHDVSILDSVTYPIITANGGINKNTEDEIRKEYKLKNDISLFKDVDVVIGFGGRFNGYYASLLAERSGKKFILALRGSDINIVKWNIDDSWYLSEACKRADKIICLSNEMVENLLSLCLFSKGKIKIIPNYLCGDIKTITFPNLPSRIKIGCGAAHLNEKKGIANILNMVNEFKCISDKPITLELVGDIDQDLKCSYCSQISTLDISNNVVFIERKCRKELFDIMSTWDFYIQGSVCEGHPNSITECLQNGTGFISTKTGYVAELLADRYSELFFDSWVPHEMACKLKTLSEHPDLQQLYQEAQETIFVSCNEEQVSSMWLDLFSHNTKLTRNIDVEHVLCVALHDVQGELHDSITTPVSVFTDFVNYVHKCGYALCSMKQYVESTDEERKHLIVCTFDDGYSNLVTIVKPILDNFNYTATVYICTELIDKDNTWNCKDAMHRKHLSLDEIRILNSARWEIASHGVTHRNLLKLSDEELDYELSTSKMFLDKLVGYSLTYAYPYGANNKFIQQCVEKYYKYAFAVSQGGTSLVVDRLQLRRYSISEIYQMLK